MVILSLSKITHKANGFAEAADGVQLLANVNERFIGRVLWIEDELALVGIIIPTLEGCFIVDDHRCNLSVVDDLL